MKSIESIANKQEVVDALTAQVKPSMLSKIDAWLLDVGNRAIERCDYDEYEYNGEYEYELSASETISGHVETISVKLDWADDGEEDGRSRHSAIKAKMETPVFKLATGSTKDICTIFVETAQPYGRENFDEKVRLIKENYEMSLTDTELVFLLTEVGGIDGFFYHLYNTAVWKDEFKKSGEHKIQSEPFDAFVFTDDRPGK